MYLGATQLRSFQMVVLTKFHLGQVFTILIKTCFNLAKIAELAFLRRISVFPVMRLGDDFLTCSLKRQLISGSST